MNEVIVTIEIKGIKKELKASDVIICTTEAESQQLFEALLEKNFKWCNGTKLDKNGTYFRSDGTGYNFEASGLSWNSRSYFERRNGEHNILYFNEIFPHEVTVEDLYHVLKEIMTEDGMYMEELIDCFGCYMFDKIITNNTPQSLVSKYQTWKESKENKIEVGDIFEYSDNDGENKEKYIVLSFDGDKYTVIWEDFTQSKYGKDFILEDKRVGHKTIKL